MSMKTKNGKYRSGVARAMIVGGHGIKRVFNDRRDKRKKDARRKRQEYQQDSE